MAQQWAIVRSTHFPLFVEDIFSSPPLEFKNISERCYLHAQHPPTCATLPSECTDNMVWTAMFTGLLEEENGGRPVGIKPCRVYGQHEELCSHALDEIAFRFATAAKINKQKKLNFHPDGS